CIDAFLGDLDRIGVFVSKYLSGSIGPLKIVQTIRRIIAIYRCQRDRVSCTERCIRIQCQHRWRYDLYLALGFVVCRIAASVYSEFDGVFSGSVEDLIQILKLVPRAAILVPNHRPVLMGNGPEIGVDIWFARTAECSARSRSWIQRSEEHTSELQSRENL